MRSYLENDWIKAKSMLLACMIETFISKRQTSKWIGISPALNYFTYFFNLFLWSYCINTTKIHSKMVPSPLSPVSEIRNIMANVSFAWNVLYLQYTYYFVSVVEFPSACIRNAIISLHSLNTLMSRNPWILVVFWCFDWCMFHFLFFKNISIIWF